MCRNTVPNAFSFAFILLSMFCGGQVFAQNNVTSESREQLVSTAIEEPEKSQEEKETSVFGGDGVLGGVEESQGKAIPFKTSAGISLLTIAQVIISLLFVLAVAYLIIWLLKKYNTGWIMGKNLQESRVSLIEVKRLTPKLSVFLIGVDDETVLLAQSGDSVSFYKGSFPNKKSPASADNNTYKQNTSNKQYNA